MSIETIPVSPGANVHTTTKRREWWGWFGSMMWLSLMMYGYEIFTLPSLVLGETASNYPLFFMITFAIAIIVFGLHFGRDPNGLSIIAFYTTPVAIMITALFALLPSPFGSVLYVISPIFMAPALTRRVFGVLHTARKGKQLARYMSAIAVCMICYAVWLIIELPKEIAFLIPSLLAIPAWFGIRRTIMLPNESSTAGVFKFSKRLLFVFVGAIILLFWLGSMNAVIYSHILSTGMEKSDSLITLFSCVLPAVGLLLFAKISDKGYERAGLINGMMLFIAGILIALLSSSNQVPWLVPLMFANGLGGLYFEFLFLTIPIYFLANSERPVFVASFGVVVELIFSIYLWIGWFPEPLRTLGAPLLFAAAFSAIGFVVLVFFLFERHREKTLAAALFDLLHSSVSAHMLSTDETLQPVETEMPDVLEQPNVMNQLFTPEEKEIAMLLIEGETQRNISRKLHLNAAEVTLQVNAIRDKVNSMGRLDPIIAAIVKEYKLTRRETDMLRSLRKSMTNAEIAADLFLSEETVRIHVRNLLKKLPVESRQDVAAWVEAFVEKKE